MTGQTGDEIRVGDRFVVPARTGGRTAPERVFTVERIRSKWTIDCRVWPPFSRNKHTCAVGKSYLLRAIRIERDEP